MAGATDTAGNCWEVGTDEHRGLATAGGVERAWRSRDALAVEAEAVGGNPRDGEDEGARKIGGFAGGFVPEGRE